MEFRQTIIWRLGEALARKQHLESDFLDYKKVNELYERLVEIELKKSPDILAKTMNDLDLMAFTFEDYQIVLSNSISPDRIIKLIPQGDQFGKITRLRKKSRPKNQEYKIRNPHDL